VNDELRPFRVQHPSHSLAVADIDGQVPVTRQRRAQFLDDRMRRTLFAEELTAHVVIDSHHLPAFCRKLADTFRADQPTGSGDKSLHSQNPLYYYARRTRKARRAFYDPRTNTYSLHPSDPPHVTRRFNVKPRRK